MSDLNLRIASFDSLINRPREENQLRNEHGDIYNCQNGNHVEISSCTSPLKLARAGFFYSTEDEKVKCFQCGKEYNLWDKESPVAVHRILNPYCPFLNPYNQDAAIETLFKIPSRPSPEDSRAYNISCCHSQQPSDVDDEVTPLENSPRLQLTGNLNQANDAESVLNTNRNIQQDQTPPSSSRPYAEYNAVGTEVKNVRRNLFPGVTSTDRVNSVGHNLTLPNCNILEIYQGNAGDYLNNHVPIQLKEHIDEYTGRIVLPKVGDKKLMVRESFRILTFPDPKDQKAEEWARNGFRYLKKDRVQHIEADCVQCVYCAGRASFNGNNIEKTHKRISPNGQYLCPMISGIDVGDVTRELEELVRSKLCRRNNDILNERSTYPIYHPQYNSVEIRLESFQYWPDQYKPNKHQLATAGFFHTGVANKVVCFCCGVAILNWKREADTWQQHALVSPTCQFVLYEKGQDFITETAGIKKLVHLDPPVTEPVCNIGNLVVPDPYPPTITRDLLTAYTSCGYSTQLLFHLVEKIFIQTCGRYPNISMLKAAVLADGELKKQVDINDFQGEVIEKNAKQLNQIEHVMAAKDQLTKSTVATINQVHYQQLNDKEQQLDQHKKQLHQQDHQHKQQLDQHKQQLDQHKQQLDQHKQQLEEKDQQYGQLEDWTSILQTAVSRHEEMEAILVQERNDTRSMVQEIERQKQEMERQMEQQKQKIEKQIRTYQRELSLLSKECSRVNNEGREERQGESNRACLFCLQEDKSVMFEPCHHFCCCTSCLPKFENCPVCRTPIQGSQKVFSC